MEVKPFTVHERIYKLMLGLWLMGVQVIYERNGFIRGSEICAEEHWCNSDMNVEAIFISGRYVHSILKKGENIILFDWLNEPENKDKVRMELILPYESY